jgi:hypothetical protein
MTTTFENAKVGDRVYDYAQAAWTTILEIDKVFITTEIRSRKHAYYLDGSSVHLARIGEQVLFWGKPEVIAPPQPPRMKLIHGVEVPDISFEPKHGEEYYAIDLTDNRFYVEFNWRDDGMDFTLYERDLCYPHTEEGKQAATLHAKAMLGIKE